MPSWREAIDYLAAQAPTETYRTESGRALDDADFNALADREVALRALDAEAEVDRLKALCAKAAHHLRTIPIQSDYKDGLMAAELEAEAKS
jgi:hypothetical protein